MAPLVHGLPPRGPSVHWRRFVTSPAAFSSRATVSAEPVLAKRSKIRRTSRRLLLDHHQPAVLDLVAERRPAAHPDALLPDAANLSRMRSPMTSRSNCAKESRMLRVSRPIEVVVLKCCVTLTKVTLWRSNTSTSFAKSVSERLRAVDLVDDDDVDQPGLDVHAAGASAPAAPACRPRSRRRHSGPAARSSLRNAGWRCRRARPRAGRGGN